MRGYLPFLIFALWFLYHLGIELPQREKQQTQWLDNFRLENQRRAAETPVKIDVRGLSPEELKQKYNVEGGCTKIKGIEYILFDSALWRVDDAW